MSLASHLAATLVAQGVADVVLAPGSRSAPLTYALAQLAAAAPDRLRLHVRLDERSAGFMALGLARAAELGGAAARPVAIVTTSGSAVAHLGPAVAEADAAGVPLVLLTADRPHEMRGTGANQTTVQAGIFPALLRRSFDLPAEAPDTPATTQHVVRALAAATGVRTNDPGPVHLNVAFREPLTPAPTAAGDGTVPAGDDAVPAGVELPQPVDLEAAPAWSSGLRVAQGDVVIAGDRAGRAAHDFAHAAALPLLAEPSSGARFGTAAIASYRALLGGALGEQVGRAIVFGHPTLSRPITRLLARVPAVVVSPKAHWTDVAGRATHVLPAAHLEGDPAPEGWLRAWQEADAKAPAPATDRQVIAHALSQLDDGVPLLIGASQVIRDLDAAPTPRVAGGPVLSNRGLAGIDGTISTAVGLATGAGRPVRVVCGDLTFLHDVTGLLRGTLEDDVDLDVIVVDDRGGGIFAALEHDEHPTTFERFFATAQDANLAHLAAGLRATYRRVAPRDLAAALAEPIRGRRVTHLMANRPERAT